MVDPLVDLFPGLARGGYIVTSPKNNKQNCIAYAAGDDLRWWWPLPADVPEVYWPAGAAREETVAAFQQAFESLGCAVCDDAQPEPGFEKIALFANEQGVPLHAARQHDNGRYRSKIGELEDIEHDLHDLEGVEYGSVVLIMKRSAKAPGEASSPPAA